jgi:hypothetical protein
MTYVDTCDGATLQIVSSVSHGGITYLLIENEENVNASDGFGVALQAASFVGNIEIV